MLRSSFAAAAAAAAVASSSTPLISLTTDNSTDSNDDASKGIGAVLGKLQETLQPDPDATRTREATVEAVCRCKGGNVDNRFKFVMRCTARINGSHLERLKDIGMSPNAFQDQMLPMVGGQSCCKLVKEFSADELHRGLEGCYGLMSRTEADFRDSAENSGFIVDRVEFLSLTPFVSPAAQGARPYAYDQQRAKSEEAAARAAGAGERKGKGKGGATE